MQRPGRVGRHEFDVDSAWANRRDRAPGLGRGEHRIEQPLERLIGEPQVDEARRRHVNGGEGRGGGIGLDLSIELFLERRGDRERRHAARSGELHGQVAGQVAVPRIGRSLDLDRWSVRAHRGVRQRTRRHGAVAGAFEGGAGLRPEGQRRCDGGSSWFGQRGLLRRIRRIVAALAKCTQPYRTALDHTSPGCELAPLSKVGVENCQIRASQGWRVLVPLAPVGGLRRGSNRSGDVPCPDVSVTPVSGTSASDATRPPIEPRSSRDNREREDIE